MAGRVDAGPAFQQRQAVHLPQARLLPGHAVVYEAHRDRAVLHYAVRWGGGPKEAGLLARPGCHDLCMPRPSAQELIEWI